MRRPNLRFIAICAVIAARCRFRGAHRARRSNQTHRQNSFAPGPAASRKGRFGRRGQLLPTLCPTCSRRYAGAGRIRFHACRSIQVEDQRHFGAGASLAARSQVPRRASPLGRTGFEVQSVFRRQSAPAELSLEGATRRTASSGTNWASVRKPIKPSMSRWKAIGRPSSSSPISGRHICAAPSCFANSWNGPTKPTRL